MTFTYTRVVREYYDPRRDEKYCDEYEFNYTPEYDELLDAVADVWIDKHTYGVSNNEEYKLAMKITKGFIEDNDLLDVLADQYQDELKEHFEEDALASERGC